MWIVPKQLQQLNGFSATAEIISDSNEFCQICASSLLARSKPMRPRIWSQKWKRDCWMQHLFGRTVKLSQSKAFADLVDFFIASYPCQGFSAAGQRKGQNDPRFLWPWVIRAVAVIQPRWVFFENVEGHVSLGLNTVISDLEAAGYRVAEGIFSAAECGAPQRTQTGVHPGLPIRASEGEHGSRMVATSGHFAVRFMADPNVPNGGRKPKRDARQRE
jgi:hypothetical protein